MYGTLPKKIREKKNMYEENQFKNTQKLFLTTLQKNITQI